MRSRAFLLMLALGFAGCGLAFDVGPPDQPSTGALDGGAFDASSSDGSTLDAGRVDAAERDGGPPAECRTAVDCDDGDACTGLEGCLDGACVPGEPVACPDDDRCDGLDVCIDGVCVTQPPETCPRDDGNPCNGIELCLPDIGCASIGAIDCDDGIDCTTDRCDPGMGECVHTENDSLCSLAPGGTCSAGSGCQYTTCDPATCMTDGCWDATCMTSSCVRSTLCTDAERCCGGTCAPIGCDDGNQCTDDSCGPSGCVNAPHTRTCSDGDACTSGDRCVGGMCTGIPTACTDGDPCTVEACDPATGCTAAGPAPDGTPCNDRDACTATDLCVAGMCRGMGTVTCDDGNLCTTDRCDRNDGCSNLPSGGTTVMCAANATCNASGMCVCNSGWFDCDMNGSCECRSSCSSGGLCTAAEPPNCDTGGAACIGTQLCCRVRGDPFYGVCGDPSCGGCCPAGA